MALQERFWPCRDRFWPCRDHFWPCDIVYGHVENVFGLARTFLALPRSFLALSRSFLALRDRLHTSKNRMFYLEMRKLEWHKKESKFKIGQRKHWLCKWHHIKYKNLVISKGHLYNIFRSHTFMFKSSCKTGVMNKTVWSQWQPKLLGVNDKIIVRKTRTKCIFDCRAFDPSNGLKRRDW